MEKQIQLIERRGDLCYPNGDPIRYMLPSGSITTIDWPRYDPLYLREALWIARSAWRISKVSSVCLPDNTTFSIDE